MILLILIICLVLCYLIIRFKDRRLYELSRQLNNDILTLPFLGHLYLFKGNNEDRMNSLIFFGRKAINNGGLAATWLGTKLLIVVADPVIAEYLSKTCLEKDEVTTISRSLIGNGSIFAPVSIWRVRRKAIAPNFSLARLNNFIDIFSEQSKIMVEILSKLEGNNAVPIFEYLVNYSFDSICETTFGMNVGAQGNCNHPFPKAFQENCQMYVKKGIEPYIYETPFYKLTSGHANFVKNTRFLRDFAKTLIKVKHQELKDEEQNEKKSELKNKDVKPFVELMIDPSNSKQRYSDLEVLEECLVLLLGGTDTSATGTAFTAMLLSRHPDVQDKVYHELQEVFGDTNRPVTAKDLTKLKYLDAVIKESLRLYPPVPVTIRKIDKDVTIPSGITLVKNSSFVIHNWAINRNPEYWGDDAEDFRPERFIDAPPKHAAAFATFSMGPRGCIGYKYTLMSMMTALIYLIRNFKVLPYESPHSHRVTGKCSEKEKPLRVKFEVMMKEIGDFKIRLESRINKVHSKY